MTLAKKRGDDDSSKPLWTLWNNMKGNFKTSISRDARARRKRFRRALAPA